MKAVTRNQAKKAAAVALVAVGAVTALSERAYTATFSWTRGNATSNTWSKPDNWLSPDGGTATPNDAAADAIFTGIPAVAGNVTQDGAQTVHSLTFDASFNPGADFNLSGSTSLISNITIGAGGITDTMPALQVKFTTPTSGVSNGIATITLGADQTWSNVGNAVSGTLNIDRGIVGDFKITKSGNGLLIFSRVNTAWTGGLQIDEGSVRLTNFDHSLGSGTLAFLSANTATITASGSVVTQIVSGPVVFSGTGTAAFSGTNNFQWDGAVTLLTDKNVSISKLTTVNGAVGGAGRFIKTGGGTLQLNQPSTNAGFSVNAGFLPIDADNKLGVAGAAIGLGGGTLEAAASFVSARPVTLSATGGTIDTRANSLTVGGVDGPGSFTKMGSGPLTADHVVAGGTLSVAAGTLNVKPNGTDSGTSKAGTILFTGGLVPTTTLDLADNDLIVGAGTSQADVETLVKAGRGAGATWDQPGISSSAARDNAAKTTSLGVISGSDYTSFGHTGTFSGQTYADTDTLVKYTWNGDTNFSGTVNFDDYVRVDIGFNTSLTGWSNGDFNYSGGVNFDDYVMIDVAYNTQSGTLGRAAAYLSGDDRSSNGLSDPAVQKVLEHFGEFGVPYASAFLAAVPEPTTLALAGMVSSLTMLRRGRRRRID